MKKITKLSEYQDLLNQPGKHIIKISASWCNPCKTLASTIQTLDQDVQDLFVEIDVDEAEEDLINNLNVRNVPVLIFYDGNKEYNRTVGAVTKDKILLCISQ